MPRKPSKITLLGRELFHASRPATKIRAVQQAIRDVGLTLRHGVPKIKAKRGKGRRLGWQIPTDCAESLRAACDLVIERYKALEMLPPIKPPEETTNVLYQAYYRILKLRRDCAGGKSDETAVLLEDSPDESAEILQRADFRLQSIIDIDPKDDGKLEYLVHGARSPSLKDCENDAYASYIYACRAHGLDEMPDKQAYEWLKTHPEPESEYVLPDRYTWCRYLRAVRRHLGRQKNTPRASKALPPTSGSVVRSRSL